MSLEATRRRSDPHDVRAQARLFGPGIVNGRLVDRRPLEIEIL